MDPDAASLHFSFLFLQQTLAFPPALGLYITQAILLLLLLLASALFSGSEVALFSLDMSAREALEQAADRASARVLTLLEQPRQVLATLLVLNTCVNVGAAVLAATLVMDLALRMGWSGPVTIAAVLVCLTLLLVIVGEITPKLIASRHATAFSRRASGVLLMLHRLLTPLSRRLAYALRTVHGRFRPAAPQHISADDLKTLAQMGEARGTLEEDERDLIHSIVEFGETSVREVMVSRLDIVAIPVSATLPEALEVIRSSGHSRLPLYVDHLDNILGIVYAKDVLPYLYTPASTSANGEQHVDWTRIARPPMFVPPGKKLDDLLRDFQIKKTHLAIVVDEYGGTAGLVTLENVLEEIVGDIRDEHDEAETALYERLGPDTYRFDARINLDDMSDLLMIDLDTEAFDFETLGGLILHITGAIPEEGEEVTYGPLNMRVEAVENHRIVRVHLDVKRSSDAGDEPEAEPITEKRATEDA